ncbi:MAG: hypothetical protein J0M15_08655 [Deltaproteobacteria bacterium]|jgi:anti-anti-sigma regulatory factor|nr:hypothetical protein [Deltaproteobacteria bacterium]
MKTEVIQLSEGYQINLIGKLDVLKTNYLKEVLARDFKNQNLVFNFSSISFVGSNGILLFFSVMDNLFHSHQISSAVIGLNDDFKKVIFVDRYPNLKFEFVNQQANYFA